MVETVGRRGRHRWCPDPGGTPVIILGIVLLLLGLLIPIPILTTLGIVLIVIGIILELLSLAGHPLGGRRHYY